jgi:hypothetical protein
MRPLRGAAGHLGDHQKRRARQGIGRIDRRGAAIGQQELPRRAARLGDAVGIGKGQQRAGADLGAACAGLARLPAQPGASRRISSARGPRWRRKASSRAPRSVSCRRARARSAAPQDRPLVPAQPISAAATIIAPSRGGSGSARSALPRAVIRPSRRARRSRPAGARLRQRRAGGRIEPASAAPDRCAPVGADRASGPQDRHRGSPAGRRGERLGLRLVPQPVADAGLGAPGAAAALVGRGARDAHGLQPRDARHRARSAARAQGRSR